MSKKQTAVEWLVNEISKSGIGNHTMIVHKKEIEQAKEIEKQQIVDAVDGFPIENRNMLGEEYYKKTYELS
jgi:hypothetical protein